MGFPAHLCEVAPQHASQDLEACIEWITVQLDSDVPLSPAARNAAAPSTDAIAQLQSMGFDESQAKLALSKNVRVVCVHSCAANPKLRTTT